MTVIMAESPRSTIWDEYFRLPAHKRADGWYVYREYHEVRTRFPWPWDWNKRREYRRWQRKWGLK